MDQQDDIPLPADWALEFVAASALLISVIGFLGIGYLSAHPCRRLTTVLMANISGNLLTVLALPNTRKLRNAATWFVVNLAFTEMIFCVTVLPMAGAHLIRLKMENKRLLNDNACRLFVFLRYTLVQAELLSIAAIAMNRCILIASPKFYRRIFTLKKSIWMVAGIWIYSSFLMAFPLFEIFGSFSYNENTQECDFDETEQTPRQIFLALGFLLPCCIIIISYSYIFYQARESARKMHLRTQQAGNPDAIRARPAEGLRNRDIRVARTIGVIFLVFVVCCTPVTVAHFHCSQGQTPTLLLMLHPVYWLQYCLNIFIYVLMNRQFREAHVNYISQWCPQFKAMADRALPMGTDDDTSNPNSPNITKSRKIRFAKLSSSSSSRSSNHSRQKTRF